MVRRGDYVRPESFHAVYARGGTSKGLVLNRGDLPDSREELSECLLALMGRSTGGQMDGMGGRTSVTNKVMMVTEATDDRGRYPYLFAQVSPEHDVVDYGGNCGNMTSAVAHDIAVRIGVDFEKKFVLHNLNTSVDVLVRVLGPVPGEPEGTAILPDGQPRSGVVIETSYVHPSGSVFGRMLPTGRLVDKVVLDDGKEVDVSILDVTSPVAFVSAAALGLEGNESPADLNSSGDFLRLTEDVRSRCAVLTGLVDDPATAAQVTPSIPKLAIVSSPADGDLPDDRNGPSALIVGRILSVQKVHDSFSLTGIMCTAAACLLSGSIPSLAAIMQGDDVESSAGSQSVRVIHPSGEVDVSVVVDRDTSGDGFPVIELITVTRTTRRLFEGRVYLD